MQGTIKMGLLAACLYALLASAADKPPRPVIEDTYISAPQRSGEYALIKTVNYADEGNVMAGVGFRYRDPLLPAMTTDIYVYPAGQNEPIEHAEKNFRATVAMAAQMGAYSDVVWGESAAFEIARPGDGPWSGRMISMRVRTKRGAVASRTYLFHHRLYDYKVRLDVPEKQAAELPAAADALVRAVLPQIRVVSVGSCGKQQQVNVLDDQASMPAGYVDGVSSDGFGIALHRSDLQQPAASGSSAKALLDSPLVRRTLLAKQRQIASGCTQPPYEPTDKSANVLKLHFPADFWRAGAARPKP